MPRDWPGKAFRIQIPEYVGWEVPCGSESLLMAAKVLQTSLHNAIRSQRTLYNQTKILQGAVVSIIITLLIVLHLLTEYCLCFPLWSKRNMMKSRFLSLPVPWRGAMKYWWQCWCLSTEEFTALTFCYLAAAPDGDSDSVSMWHISLPAARKLFIFWQGRAGFSCFSCTSWCALQWFCLWRKVENCLHAPPAHPGLLQVGSPFPSVHFPTHFGVLSKHCQAAPLHHCFQNAQFWKLFLIKSSCTEVVGGVKKMHAQGLGWERSTGFIDPSDSRCHLDSKQTKKRYHNLLF